MSSPLTIVLPLTLHERLPPGKMLSRWRDSPDKHTRLRLKYLLYSFSRFFDISSLYEFLIICPDTEVPAVRSLVEQITNSNRFAIIPETAILYSRASGKVIANQQGAGWAIQQLVKLYSAYRVRTPYYITCDSDILLVKPLTSASLFVDDRSVVNIETDGDYYHLYRAEIAARECAIKSARSLASMHLLEGNGKLLDHNRHYGETPVVLNTNAVRSLLGHLQSRLEDLPDALLGIDDWTEYSLYFCFLRMIGQLDLLHCSGHRNSILDLDSSIWFPTASYLKQRDYDARHFSLLQTSDRGFFIAVQSWLPTSSWLPSRYETVAQFYEDLASWLQL